MPNSELKKTESGEAEKFGEDEGEKKKEKSLPFSPWSREIGKAPLAPLERLLDFASPRWKMATISRLSSPCRQRRKSSIVIFATITVAQILHFQCLTRVGLSKSILLLEDSTCTHSFLKSPSNICYNNGFESGDIIIHIAS
ncbi:hypothetical protein HAX54_043824 [Datura stramonium]|uniref:Uncharacterized protein n=1 Tax=Datura stramonium TaxID=4076 RepID=A0ABS8SP55_DATST|nr:hypothetical protein [Datura stramonium]